MENLKTYNEYINGDLFHIKTFEDYSLQLKESYSKSYKCKIFEYDNCYNFCIIPEGSFNRLLNKLQNEDFVIMAAHRDKFSKQENVIRNRKLRKILNDKKIRVYQLLGHWLETPEGKEDNDCKRSELTDVVERAYVIVRPKEMPFDDFKQLRIELMTIDGATQDCCVIHEHDNSYYLLYPDNSMKKIGDNLTLDKISQAYSEYVVNKKNHMTFVFEGIECPGSIGGYITFEKNMINYCK